jgi:hypothetical protein
MAKNKEAKEKPLDKLTAKELREMALAMDAGIVGVHAMNKAELITAVKEAKGIKEEKTKKADADVRSIKAKIKQLQEKRSQAKVEGNRKLTDRLRRRISNLKKKTRRAA